MERDDENTTAPSDPRTQQQPQRSSISSFVFIIFMLFMLTNHSSDEYLARTQYQDALQIMNDQLSNFTAWMNGEGSNFTMVGVRACCAFYANVFVAGERAGSPFARTILRSIRPTVRLARRLLLSEHDWIYTGPPRLLQHHAFQPRIVQCPMEVSRTILDVGYQYDRTQ